LGGLRGGIRNSPPARPTKRIRFYLNGAGNNGMVKNGVWTPRIPDRAGSTAMESGALSNYEGYGNQTAGASLTATSNPYGYDGYYTDAESGLCYLNNRYYDPTTQRFTQQDPALDGGNWYGYCGGDPVNRLDDTGESWKSFWGGVGKVAKTVGNAIVTGAKAAGNAILPGAQITAMVVTPLFDANVALMAWAYMGGDWAGRDILYHWLYGNGKEADIYNDKKWSKYMMDSQSLKYDVADVVRKLASKVKNNTTKKVKETTKMKLSNDGYRKGYEYLHGTDKTVGGFTINGTITKDKNGNATANLTYQWNDIIDPNGKYPKDKTYSKLCKIVTAGYAKDYTIRIRWSDTSVLNAKGKFTSGWLKDA